VFIVSVIFKVTHILQFIHQLLNLPALLLDDALLKCYRSLLAFNCFALSLIDISRGSARHN